MCRSALKLEALADALWSAGAGLLLCATAPPSTAGQEPVPLTDEFRVNAVRAGWQVQADVAAHPSGGVLVVWNDFGSGGPGGNVYARRLASDGSALGDAFRINTDPAHAEAHPAVAVTADGRYVVVWTGASDGNGTGIVGRRLEEDGLALSAPFAVNTSQRGSQSSADVAPTGDGGFVVVWVSQDERATTPDDSVRGRRFGPDATPKAEEFELAEASLDIPPDPSVAASPDGRILASWSDASGLKARLYALDGSPAADAVQLASRHGSRQSRPSAAAIGGGGFVLAWASEDVPGSRRIRALRLDADGRPLGDDWPVSLEDPGRDATFPQVAADADGGLVVVWQEFLAANDPQPTWDVHGRFFSKTAEALGGPFQLSSTRTQHEGRPATAITPDGHLVAVWERALQDGNDPGDVLARLWQRPLIQQTSVSTPARTTEAGSQIFAPAPVPAPQPAVAADCPDCTLVHTFKLTTLNVQLFSVIKQVHNAERAEALGDDFASSPWDVVLIQEGFSEHLSHLSQRAGCGSRFEKCAFQRPFGELAVPPTNGGLGLLSAFDFDEKPQAGVKWSDCHGITDNASDCLANKGFYHAQLKVPNDLDPRNPVVLDVINLHHDAGNCDTHKLDPTKEADCAENGATRLKQLRQLKRHLDLFPSGLVVLAGDFNTVAPPCRGVACDDVHEYARIKAELDVAGQREFRDAWFEGGDGGPGFTADSLTQTVNRTCNAEPGELGCRQERIDHIWVSDAGTCYRLKVKDVRVETMPANGRVPPHEACKNESCEHLSDHFGVSSTIEVWRDNTRLSAPPCGGQLLVEIVDPPGRVTAAETRTLLVRTPADATGVRLLVDGSSADVTLVHTDGMTHTFEWSVPDQQVEELSYRLRAEGAIAGTLRFHEITVRATKSFGPGSVKFVNPVEGQELVFVGATETVKVSAPGATSVQLTISPADGGAGGNMTETAPGSGAWIWEGWKPASAGTRYLLAAQASPPSVGNAQVWVKAVDPNGPQIVWPTPSSTLSFGKRAQVVVVAPWDATDIRLTITRGATLELGPKRRFNDLTRSSWEFEWIPSDVTNGQPFVLQAYDGKGDYGPSPTVAVEVTNAPDAIAPSLEFLQPGPDQKLAQRGSVTFPVWVRASDNQGVTSVTLKISGPEPRTFTSSASCGPHCYQFVWTASKSGRYTLEAVAADDSGNTQTVSVGVDVTILNYPMEKTPIDRDSFLLRIWDINDSNPVDDTVVVSTGIPDDHYACAIVGYKASGGDIEEEKGGREIIRAILDHPGDDWRLHLNFKTGGKYATGVIPLPVPPWFWPTYDYTDRPETWEATLLCVSRQLASLDGPEPGKPLFLKTYPGLGHDVYQPTEFPVSDYACGVAGFFNTRGDINEKDSRNPIEVYAYPESGYWHIRAGFATHGDEKQDWTVNLICVSTKAAALGGPQPGKRYLLKELGRFNDPAEGTTGISDRYACGLVGFRAFGGNIDEHNKDGDTRLFWAFLYPHGDATWHFRGDIRSEDDNEDWERVSILCATKGPTVNVAPEITPLHPKLYLSLSQWKEIDFEVEASDANWDEVRLFAASLPDGATFPDETGQTRVKATFRFALPALGEMEWRDYPITFTAADHELSSARTVTIRVCGIGIADCERLRHYPRLGPLSDQQVMAGQLLSFRVSASDKDDDWLLLTVGCRAVPVAPRTTRCEDGPVGAEFTIEDSFEGYARGRFSWTPDTPAIYPVRFSAYDTDRNGYRADGNDHATIHITVTENPASLPDLTVAAFGWPTTAAPGATVNFTYMIRNEGTAAAVAANGGFLTRLLVNGQPVPNEGGRVGSRRTERLGVGASSTNGFQWQASCGAQRVPVEFQVSVQTDAERQVLEKRETNNQTPVHRLVVDCTPPDLEVVAGSICTQNKLCEGAPLEVHARVRNLGPVVAPASRVGFGMYKSDCSVVHAPLGPLDTQEVSCSLTAPYAAEWPLYVTVDSLGQVVEANEANNLLIKSGVRVESCQLPTLPDLTVRALRFTPSTARAGEPVTVQAEIVNRGTAVYTMGAEAIVSAVDKAGSFVRSLCDEWHDFELAPGASTWVSCATPGFTQGLHHVKAEVWGFDEESSYCNNAATVALNVQPAAKLVVPIEK